MERIPIDRSHVSALLTFTESISDSTILAANSSSIKSPLLAITSLFEGLFSSPAQYLPIILSYKLSITSPASIISFYVTPLLVPQSSLVMIKSCATSTNLLVR